MDLGLGFARGSVGLEDVLLSQASGGGRARRRTIWLFSSHLCVLWSGCHDGSFGEVDVLLTNDALQGCEKPFEDPSFFQRESRPYCEGCFSVIIKNEL